MTTNYAGINYAGRNSTVNRDPDAGIRYGVISQNAVLQAWADDSEAQYPSACTHCGSDIDQAIIDAVQSGDDEDKRTCPHCKVILEEKDFWDVEADYYAYDDDGYKAQSDDYGDIFITKSPYYTYAQFCSPCAPGACHLSSPLTDPISDNRCYCFGHDWFEDGKAPYPVYSVETGEVVEPSK